MASPTGGPEEIEGNHLTGRPKKVHFWPIFLLTYV